MAEIHLTVGAIAALPKNALQALMDNLVRMGYEVVGPKIKDDTVIYTTLTHIEELPRGYSSHQDAGTYRLEYTGSRNYFDITPGPQSWKQYFFPSRTQIASYKRDTANPHAWQVEETETTHLTYALIGVRPCELAAIQVQDRVFLRDDFKDPVYYARRQSAFILAVNCLHPCGTCFCASMGFGPEAESGYDLNLSELEEIFLVRIGSEAGRMAMMDLPLQPASAYWIQAANRGLEEARQNMGRSLPYPDELRTILLENLDLRHYDNVAKRCLSCANCTLVCPTCFCWDVQDINNLTGNSSRRERIWDSCFNPEYSHVFGGNSRPSARSRYRQWITHKLAGWYQQFGTSGCVGCGRCITWCPAGIDITAEAAALREEVHA